MLSGDIHSSEQGMLSDFSWKHRPVSVSVFSHQVSNGSTNTAPDTRQLIYCTTPCCTVSVSGEWSSDSVLYNTQCWYLPCLPALGLSVLPVIAAQLWQTTRCSYESRQKWPTVQKWFTRGTPESAQNLPVLALRSLETLKMDRKICDLQYLGKTGFKLAQNRTKKISIDVGKDP